MFERFLIGILAGLEQSQDIQNENDTNGLALKENTLILDLMQLRSAAKFHIGMLTISLIVGLVFGGLVTYQCWAEKNFFLSYVRNLVIALVCRTFFSILFEGVVILSESNAAGGNTLLAFESISANLVLAFWLTFTIYMHARVQRNFNSEPSLRLYQYGVPGVAVFFAFVWIFVMQAGFPSLLWILVYVGKPPFAFMSLYAYLQWVLNSVRLLFLFVQLGLVGDMTRMIMKFSVDNDSISILRKIAFMMGSLLLIFWFQFGFSVGSPILEASSSYLYFFYFVDGLQCGLVCLVLFFFNKWVLTLNKISQNWTCGEEELRQSGLDFEVLLSGPGDRGIVTVDSVFMTRESGTLREAEAEKRHDVVYSSVVQSQNLKKTIDLYKRLNVIPANEVTVYDGETFFDCDLRSSQRSERDEKTEKSLPDTSFEYRKEVKNEFKNGTELDRVQKKNAFYSSKYLILDSKEKDIPKRLETRPSVSPGGKGIPREERQKEALSSSLETLSGNDSVNQRLDYQPQAAQRGPARRISRNEECESVKAPISQLYEAAENYSYPSNNESLNKVVSMIKSAINIFDGTHGKKGGETLGKCDTADISDADKGLASVTTVTQSEELPQSRLTSEISPVLEIKQKFGVKGRTPRGDAGEREPKESDEDEASKICESDVTRALPKGEPTSKWKEQNTGDQRNQTVLFDRAGDEPDEQENELGKSHENDCDKLQLIKQTGGKNAEFFEHLRAKEQVPEIVPPKLENQSESEFELEKERESSSSTTSSFCVDEYYSAMFKIRSNFSH